MTIAFLNECAFLPSAPGLSDFVVSEALDGYYTPAQCTAPVAVNGGTYHYRAESDDLTQYESGIGTYTTATQTLARTTIYQSSSAGAKVNFTNQPRVRVTLLAQALGSLAQITPAAGVATFLETPSSANLASAVTDETGSGALVFGTSPTLTTSVSLSSGFVFSWAGDVTLTHSANTLTFAGASSGYVFDAHLLLNSNSIQIGGLGNVGLILGNDLFNITMGGANDLRLCYDGSGIFAQRNSTNAQTFRIYNTYTDSSNYERASLGWASNVFVIDASEEAGTGTARDLKLVGYNKIILNAAGSGAAVLGSPAGFFYLLDSNNDTNADGSSVGIYGRNGQNLKFTTSAANRWEIGNSTGHLLAGTDNTYDIGASGATRPRDLHIARQLVMAAGTITDSKPLFDLSQTWNDAADTFTALKLNVTDTNSAAASLLLDLQVGGSSKFKVDKNGMLATEGSSVGSYGVNTTSVNVSQGINIASAGYFQFAGDTILFRDAAQTLAQRNSTNAQTFRIYNTYTDASNYERIELSWVANQPTLTTTAAGTGTARGLNLGSANGYVTVAAHIVGAVSNTYDLGTSGTKYRDLYLGNDLMLSSASIINFDSGDVTVTHSANALAFAGASNGYSFDSIVTSTNVFSGAVGYYVGNSNTWIRQGTANEVAISEDLNVKSDQAIGWGSGAAGFYDSPLDTTLFRDGAANVIAQRNGTNAQTFRIYNTYTDASNYERAAIQWSSNVLRIETEKAGTGASRAMSVVAHSTLRLESGSADIDLWTSSTSNIRVITDNNLRWYFNSAGHFLAGGDNSYDIGASGATRPRSLYLGTSLVVGSSNPFSDAAGTLTLQNVDALDATTEATIEAAIDTLANLTSIQGRTVTLADAGANAIFGWDDTAGAYENLSAAEATAILNNVVGDSGAGGTKGLVPAPAAGDAAASKFLKADGTWVTPPGGGDALTANPLSQFAATTSLQLKNTISDETGSGALVFANTPTLVTPVIGAATGTSLAATGAITSSGTAGIGYATGAGGTVTQATSKSTAVTLDKICGQITMNNAALGAGGEVSFTVNNSTVAATDCVIVNHVSGVGTADNYIVWVGGVAAGSFVICVSNASTGSLSQAIVLNFAVIKAVTS